MPTLIISDVHERLDRLAIALEGRAERADRIVFLGDWFDAFGPVDLEKIKQVCQWLNRNAAGVDITPFVDFDATCGAHTITKRAPAEFLLGNHDCHYFFRSNGFKCSGYEPAKQEVIDRFLAHETKAAFKISTKVGPYLCSHAGYCEATLQYHKPEVEREALKTAFEGRFDPLFGAGRARGGSQRFGGPTWLDWNYEFEHIDDLPQIVGHTHGKTVRMKGKTTADASADMAADTIVSVGLPSYCLDTALHHILWVHDDGRVEIEQTC